MEIGVNANERTADGTTGAQPYLPMRVLFLCGDNSARSQMAEAILRSLGARHFTAFSAGATPAGAVDPDALAILEQHHVSSDGLIPKPVQTFAGQSFDYVITVCDPATEEPPSFPGADVLHWSFVDPARALEGQMDPHPFEHLFAGLAQRIRLLMVIAERREREHGSQATRALVDPPVRFA